LSKVYHKLAELTRNHGATRTRRKGKGKAVQANPQAEEAWEMEGRVEDERYSLRVVCGQEAYNIRKTLERGPTCG
jgi:hypothetical protein